MKTGKKRTKLVAKLLVASTLFLSVSACQRPGPIYPVNNLNGNYASSPQQQFPGSTSTLSTLSNQTVKGQVVVKFRKNMSQGSMQQFATQQKGRIVSLSTRLNSMIIEFRDDVNFILKNLNNNSLVEYAEPNYKYSVNFTVNDPRSSEQNGLAVANLAKAWDITQGDPRVVIAVVDTGVDINHPDLRKKLVPGYNVITGGETPPQDDNGHGTHVSGIAAAQTDNKEGIAGTAPRCSVMPIKVLDMNGSTSNLLDVALGIVWAVDHGARVINLSLGGPESITFKRAVDYALLKNVVVVAAMGNDSKRIKKYPAGFPGVISVGSVDIDKYRSDFSNWGNWISVVAPGRQIMSTLPMRDFTMEWEGLNPGYDRLDGTSMASPIVAGIVGLMLSRNPSLTPAQVKSKLEATSTDLGSPGYDEEYGHGLVNAVKAVL